MVIFDADFMPRRNYLWRVLPVFSEKRERPIGLVQTPQFFYNVNSDEDVWDHLNVSFFHRIEPSLDQWSAVNCCGTNFTVRAGFKRKFLLFNLINITILKINFSSVTK